MMNDECKGKLLSIHHCGIAAFCIAFILSILSESCFKSDHYTAFVRLDIFFR
jgi:hypothetical protein